MYLVIHIILKFILKICNFWFDGISIPSSSTHSQLTDQKQIWVGKRVLLILCYSKKLNYTVAILNTCKRIFYPYFSISLFNAEQITKFTKLQNFRKILDLKAQTYRKKLIYLKTTTLYEQQTFKLKSIGKLHLVLSARILEFLIVDSLSGSFLSFAEVFEPLARF